MIVSKNGKTYDTSDGSEQQFHEPPARNLTAGQAAKERWEDEGGPLNDPAVVFGKLHATKPSWSVLSLRDLNEAIRREHQADHPARLQQEVERAERKRIQKAEVEARKAAAIAHAERNRYRNAWEHT